MAAVTLCCRRIFGRIIERNGRISCRLISTTERKKDANETSPPETIYKKIPDFSKPNSNKNWVSYGLDLEDKSEDRFLTHVYFFGMITIAIVLNGFMFLYYPDKKLQDWAQREAFIRLNEREMLGLDPIDMNYVDPANVVLPPDEDLSDDEIII